MSVRESIPVGLQGVRLEAMPEALSMSEERGGRDKIVSNATHLGFSTVSLGIGTDGMADQGLQADMEIRQLKEV